MARRVKIWFLYFSLCCCWNVTVFGKTSMQLGHVAYIIIYKTFVIPAEVPACSTLQPSEYLSPLEELLDLRCRF